MPLRRVVGIALIGVLVVSAAATATVLFTAPGSRITHPYSSRHTFVSAAAGICVEVTAQGTASATRNGRAPFVRWTEVQLSDPTMIATGYSLTAGHCDHAHRVRLAATLQQQWSTSSGATSSRRSDEGPAMLTLRQFNTGSPVRLPDRGFPTVFDVNYPISGDLLIDARLSSGSEGFTYRTTFALKPEFH